MTLPSSRARTVTTARLLLRPMTQANAADLAERRSDPDTATYQGWSVPYSVERATELIAEMEELGAPTPGHWFQFACVRRADAVIVGDVALHLDDDVRNAQIGYTLNKSSRGQGFATEAAAGLISYAFDDWGVHRIAASCDPRNVASVRVLERLGFRHEGTLVESYWLGDTVSDDALYGLLRRDWRGLGAPS